MARRISADLGGLVDDLESGLSKALEWAVRDAKTELNGIGRRYGGGDARLSGVGRPPGSKLSARYDFLKGSRGLAVRVRAVGPWQLPEYGRRGGYPIPKRAGKGRNRARRGQPPRLHVGDEWVTGRIRGGRDGGRGDWNAAVPRILDGMGDSMAKAIVRTLDRW